MEGLLSPPSPPFHGREGEGSRTAPLHSQLNSRIEFDRNPNPEAGHCAAALSPPARSGRNQWCPISPATPLVPSPLDRDGAARHLCPISAFGINLEHRRVGRAVLCPPRLPIHASWFTTPARTECRALPNRDPARAAADPWVDQSRFIHPSFIGMYPVCSCY